MIDLVIKAVNNKKMLNRIFSRFIAHSIILLRNLRIAPVNPNRLMVHRFQKLKNKQLKMYIPALISQQPIKHKLIRKKEEIKISSNYLNI